MTFTPNALSTADRQRLDECGLVERQVLVDPVDPAILDHDVLRESAAAAAESDEVHVGRDVVCRGGRGGVHVIVEDVGLDDDMVTDGEVVDPLADLGDDAGELVAEGDRGGLAGDRVGGVLGGAEDRSVQVLVQVGTADAGPGDVDPDGAGFQGLLIDVLDADVVVAVVACCLHGCSTFRSRYAVTGPSVGRPHCR
jgi:hypothetical protein